MMKLVSIIFLIAFLFGTSPSYAQSTCNPSGNPTGAWVQSFGTYTTGNKVIFGPSCEQVQDGGPSSPGQFVEYTSGPQTLTTAQCSVSVILSGNAYFTVNIGSAASFGICNLDIRNGDIYTGAGSGRAKLIVLNGYGQFNLYPGQHLNLQSDTIVWKPDCPLKNDGLGCVWNASAAVQFFIDPSLGNDNNDGLALGGGNALQHKTRCVGLAYNVLYTKNFGTVQCSQVAGSNAAEFVSVFYPMNGGGTLLFDSATPGSRFTWTCPVNQGCLQFGDGALVGATDVAWVQNPSSSDIISGHNHGVFDLNTNNDFGGANGTRFVMSCDFDTHFNVNNGFTYFGVFQSLMGGNNTNTSGVCQGGKWNINGAVNTSAAAALSRFAIFQSGQLAVFQGNVTFGTTGLTTSGVSIVSGNSVLNNESGSAPPGGAPVPGTGGQYCTSLC